MSNQDAADRQVRCPTHESDGTPIHPNNIPGCGSQNVAWSEEEGLYDCLDCGIWFQPPRSPWTAPANQETQTCSK